MENGQLTAEQINAMITQAVNNAVAPIIEGLKGYSNPQPKPEEQPNPEEQPTSEEEVSEAVKAFIDSKQPQQRPAQQQRPAPQQRPAQAQQQPSQQQSPEDGVSEATKQWLQHKEEGKDQGKEF